MSEPELLSVEVNGFATRVWRAGSGPKLGFLAGFGGLPRWIPFLDALARERTVIVPSLPGFPGGDRGHTVLDSHLDWVLALRQLLQKAGLEGADIAGGSVGGSFAAATLLGVSDVAGKYYVPALGAFLIYAVMVALLMWRPAGLFGRR